MSTTTQAWWPLPDGPYALIDGWEDGGIEERCWVPVRIVDGSEYDEERARGGRIAAALAFIGKTLDYELASLARDGLALELSDGTTWQRPEGKPAPDGLGGMVVPTDDPCDDHEEESCTRCFGTGKTHLRYDDSHPWISCEPTDEGAVEFYVLEVVDV